MILQDLCDAAGQPLARLDVQELIGAVRVRLRSQQSGDQELSFGKALTQHAHERNRTTCAHVH